MIETISSCIRTARKQHTCDLCCGKIQPGEKYNYTYFNNDGQAYGWKEHEKCSYISGEIWDYCDPWDGMNEEIFKDAVIEICSSFVCPMCQENCVDCNQIDKVYDLLKKYELYMAKREGCCKEWKLRERKKDGEQE